MRMRKLHFLVSHASNELLRHKDVCCSEGIENRKQKVPKSKIVSRLASKAAENIRSASEIIDQRGVTQ